MFEALAGLVGGQPSGAGTGLGGVERHDEVLSHKARCAQQWPPGSAGREGRRAGRLGLLRLCSTPRRKPIGRGPHLPGTAVTTASGRGAADAGEGGLDALVDHGGRGTAHGYPVTPDMGDGPHRPRAVRAAGCDRLGRDQLRRLRPEGDERQ
ncbi:hypothetical protein Shyhy02_13980 [Streptomyces hygroscopicus subsp. hygroscopicus]|nr:hypothetical protein Shyhy02_13980 [Streptomyces hygroscopicus subsp. hygroscopicus]